MIPKTFLLLLLPAALAAAGCTLARRPGLRHAEEALIPGAQERPGEMTIEFQKRSNTGPSPGQPAGWKEERNSPRDREA